MFLYHTSGVRSSTTKNYSGFALFPKDNISTKLFTWLMKVNIPLIFQFACMHLYPSYANCWLAGLCTVHRTDYRQARGHVTQTAGKTLTETADFSKAAVLMRLKSE